MEVPRHSRHPLWLDFDHVYLEQWKEMKQHKNMTTMFQGSPTNFVNKCSCTCVLKAGRNVQKMCSHKRRVFQGSVGVKSPDYDGLTAEFYKTNWPGPPLSHDQLLKLFL